MKISDGWIKHIKDVNSGIETGSEKDVCFDYTVKLDSLCREFPEEAWIEIVDIYNKSVAEENILNNLSAGPLEDLLVYHGDETISKVEKFLEEDSNFVEVIEGVWRNQIRENIWKKLQYLTNKYSKKLH